MRQNESNVRAEFGVVDQKLTALRSPGTPPGIQSTRPEETQLTTALRRDAEAFEAERWDGMS